MGRYPLLILAALAVGACASEETTPQTAGGDPHASLACTECHDGGLADRGLAAVPSATCGRSGCHDKNLPDKVTIQTVSFDHTNHGASGSPPAGCAGCHTHSAGGQPITAGPETCGLCHADELSGARGEDCRLCHQSLNHTGMTSQGVAIPHEGLPWIEGGCLRCHYAVSKPVHEVSLTRCAQCHDDVQAATARGIGEDLHPAHAGNSCGSCHEEDNHRIEAMSSAVDLDCAACHKDAHGVNVDHGWLETRTCDACHGSEHQGPQRLLLGILPDTSVATPSDHFMDGLTCRSCHLPGSGSADAARVGSSVACVQCHRSEYATVLRWWNQGIAERTRMVDRYLAGAEEAVEGRDTTDAGVRATRRARSLLELVRAGGGQHNLPLTHRIFQDVVAGASQAYRSVGRVAPSPPQLGRAPRQGICSYCHYTLPEPGFSENMDDAFHREVLGGR
ncbi:MAG: cytochrome c3 family protein [Gemmatimonadota bacterium]|jgi:hypothetical protein